MMRFLGNTVAKSCRMGRLQYRDFSSAADVTTTNGKKIVGYCFKVAFLGGGYMLGGLTTSPDAKKVLESEEKLIRDEKFLAEEEAKMDGY